MCGATPEASRTAASGERRQLTVLFGDLVGSTALSLRLDPEDLREVLRAYHESAVSAVEDYGGSIAQYLGDGLLAYFGYPLALEDAGPRAVHAALRLQATSSAAWVALCTRVPELASQAIAARVAVHTGTAIVTELGSGAKREQLALGGAVNVAARLQATAEPGSVVISETTRALVEGHFRLEPHGEHAIPGLDRPLKAFRVRAAQDARGSRGRRLGQAQRPLLGRDHEMALLFDRWEEAKEGHGQVVLVRGEAGIGKSRLVEELHTRLAPEAHRWLETSCSPFHQDSAFHPIAQLASDELGFAVDEAAESKLAKLEAGLIRAGLEGELAALVAPLLAIPARSAETGQSPAAQRRRALEVLLRWLFALASQTPSVLMIEDLHWIDASTAELLENLADQVASTPVMLVVTARPEFQPPWLGRSNVALISLKPLRRRDAAAMASEIAAGSPLPAPVLDEIVRKTDGVPLFVEEMTRALVEAPARGRSLEIPTTLYDSLLARLDRLGSAREAALVAAVLGREFSHELLERVWEGAADALSPALRALVDAELLYARGFPPNAQYSFKHALIQEAAYRMLLRSDRRRIHTRVAEALSTRFAAQTEAQPEVTARHFEEAELLPQAIALYRRAGVAAVRRSANREAIAHLTRAVTLLERLPETPERMREELVVRVACGAPLIAARSYADQSVETNFARALELCRKVGDEPALAPALYGLSTFYLNRMELKTCIELSEQMLDQAQRSGDASCAPWARQQLGCAYFFMGSPARAASQLESAIEAYRPEQHDALAFVYGQDASIASRSLASFAAFGAGDLVRSLALSDAAVALAREKGHPFSLSFALTFAAYTHALRRDRGATREAARAAIEYAREQEVPVMHGYGRLLAAWADAERDPESAVAEIRASMEATAQAGAMVGAPFAFALLADAQRARGDAEGAENALDAGLALSAQSDVRFWESDLLREKALLRLRAGRRDEGQRMLARAAEIASQQGMRIFALRAACAALRLAPSDAAARAALAEARAQITADANAADAQDADALLAASR